MSVVAPPKPQSHDELEALIREARARQLRRRLLGAAAVAIAAALGLGLYVLLVGGGLNGVGRSRSTPAAPACRSSELAASAELNGAAFGTMEGGATLTNIGQSACSLPGGRPTVAIFWQGRIMPTRETAIPSKVAPPLRLLAPQAKATILLSWANWCGRPREGTVGWIRPTYRLRFADGLRVEAPGRVATPPGCLNKRGVSVLAVSPPVRLKL
jgi:Protein of unknown function (DUF4232)